MVSLGTRDDRPAVGADVEVRIPADLSQLFVVRSIAATFALREDFDLDEVEDVKLAVDEMCSALVLRARPGEQLTCRFDAMPRSVGVVASVPSDRAAVPEDTFGWWVLAALTDELRSWATGREVHIGMTKTRARD